MLELCVKVGGRPVQINVVERPDDLPKFVEFVRANQRGLGFDTETTGLDWWSPDYLLRLAQFGTGDESWVLPVEAGPEMAAAAAGALRFLKRIFIHNASFDGLVVDRHLGVPIEEIWPKILDTKIVSHLVDPRGEAEGGTGHSLAALTSAYLDTGMGLRVKQSMTDIAKSLKTTKAKVWRAVPRDHPGYLTYAGLDPVLAYRLAVELAPRIPASAVSLVDFEHRVGRVCALMQRTGLLLDVDYTTNLAAALLAEETNAAARATELGCDNVNAPAAVAEALMARGVKLTKRTNSGQWAVSKHVLQPLADAGDDLAAVVLVAKKTRKARITWVERFLTERSASGRCHAFINPLQARTGRMSISGIPAQTLPSGDSLIRSCFVAEPGHRIMSVDYAAQELRILAALSGDMTMTRAFAEGADLHQLTADASGVLRKVGKTVNFSYVYGGGAGLIASQAGIDYPTARRVINGFERAYPKVKLLSQRLASIARDQGYITTPTGRRLPVDATRPYAALNYLIQSTGRDVTCRGLVRLHDAGLTEFMRLPIHDEVLFSVPAQYAESAARRTVELMAEHLRGVDIATDAQIGERSWGSLYTKAA